MTNISEFKGETKESITTLKEKVENIEHKVESIDKRIWLIILLMAMLLGDKVSTISNIVGSALAWGK